MSEKDRVTWVLALPVIAIVGVCTFSTEGLAQERVAESPTYAGDVAAVLQVCTQCHNRGSHRSLGSLVSCKSRFGRHARSFVDFASHLECAKQSLSLIHI